MKLFAARWTETVLPVSARLALGLTLATGLVATAGHVQAAPQMADAPGSSSGSSAPQTPPPSSGSVQSLMNEARGHMAAGRYERAREVFQQVLAMEPNNGEAQQGLTEALARLEQGRAIGTVSETDDILQQQARVEFDDAMRRARRFLNEQDYDQAQQTALTAKVRVERARQFLGPAEYGSMIARVDGLLDQIRNEKAEVEEQRRLLAEEQALETQARERAEDLVERRRIIDENLRRVRELQAELKFEEAMQVIDRILFLDPINPAALALRDVMDTAIIWTNYQDIQRQKDLGYAFIATDNRRSMVPPRRNISGPGNRSTSGIYEYPPDWPDITFRRTMADGFIETPENRTVLRKLSGPAIPATFEGNTVKQALGYIEEVSDTNIYVDWRSLDLIGVSPDDTIHLDLGDVPAEIAIERVLDQVGNEFESPEWTVEDGIVTVASEQALRRRKVTLVYDIRDLLFDVPMFDNAPELFLNTSGDQGMRAADRGATAGGGSGYGGGASTTVPDGDIFSDPGEDPDRVNREQIVSQITDIIRFTIDPEGWRELGGETGSIQELNGNLIITNTPNNHREIEGLLSQLREIRALQINVESRFLEVNTDWFEQIGVDLDLYFNTNGDLYDSARAADPNFQLSDFFGPDGNYKDTIIFRGVEESGGDPASIPPGNTVLTGGAFGVPTADGTGITYQQLTPAGQPIRLQDGFAPIGVVQDSLGLASTVAGLTDFGTNVLNANPALSLGVQFLDDIQVDLLVEATQADRRSVVLTAPRLTFHNGQRAFVAVLTQTAYVGDLTAVTGSSSGAFEPVINTLNEGFVLDVEGVISADRRYVTMTVDASFTQNAGFFDSVDFGGAAGGGGTGGGTAGEFFGTIQLPQLSGSYVQTTVTVPDKGTILLGGQRNITEIEVETGVPVLSKIPFINRFFTNRITSTEENTLLILIRPEIIIQQENEDLLFPGLLDSQAAGGFGFGG